MELSLLPTPSLVLDHSKLLQNIHGVQQAVMRHPGVSLRPHLKTTKSIDVAERILRGGTRKIAVSTLREADYFIAHGITDILYAITFSPDKLARIRELISKGGKLTIVTDDLSVAQSVAALANPGGQPLSVMIEVDCDGQRSGVDPDGSALLAIARVLQQAPELQLTGVMVHAGAAYECETREEIMAIAERERSSAARAAERLRSSGVLCASISIGSTPTVLLAGELTGVTEARAGVGFLNDLTMVGLGVCTLGDVAISVLTTVIGHRRLQNQVIVDAGWTSLSSDRSRASQRVFNGYGLVTDLRGRPLLDLGVIRVNQEHGIVGTGAGRALPFDRIPIGTKLRILPNHACATSAGFSEYRVLDVTGHISATWKRCLGW